MGQLIRGVESQIAMLERRRKFLMAADRKQEARKKFMLGAIVVRAGLSAADRTFLLGGLLELAKLSADTSEYRRLHYIGEIAFRAKASQANFSSLGEATE